MMWANFEVRGHRCRGGEMSAHFAFVQSEAAGQLQSVLVLILSILLALVFLMRREPWAVLAILARRVIKG
jgi:hypothetical protein